MTRVNFDRQLGIIKEEVLVLGSMVEEATQASVDALAHWNVEVARRVISDDKHINEKRYAIENALIILMSTQSPMARDLRLMAALLEVTVELERMGDYAKGIAKVTLKMGDRPDSTVMNDLFNMAALSIRMLRRSLEAFMAQDSSMARQLPREDEQIDMLYNQVYLRLVSTMIANPAFIDPASHLLWAAHNLERMADRVTNICERTVFISTGELLELDACEVDSGS